MSHSSPQKYIFPRYFPLLLIIPFFLIAFLMFGDVPIARAATINVTTTDDEVNSDGDCSLREAIRAANLDQAVDGCTAGNGADTITLPTGNYV